VVVHPECIKEVVDLADGVGSTNYIMEFVEKAPKDATIAVGTEIHLVNRLHDRFKGVKNVLPLARSLCPNMYRVNLANLLETLEKIPQHNQITVPSEIVKNAKKALEKMLDL